MRNLRRRAATTRLVGLIPALLLLAFSASLCAAEFYNDWATNHMGSVPSQSSPTNDPDSDGVVNLAEYTFGTDPLVSDGIGNAIVALPPETNGVYRMDIFERAGHRPGVQINLDATANLTNWIRSCWVRTLTNSLPDDPTNSVRELFTTHMPDTNIFFARGMIKLFDRGPEVARFYIVTNGNDSTGNGSITNPYATLAKATGQANPGDLIYVRGGTYNPTAKTSLSRSGTAAQPIRVRAYPGEQPILNCSGVGSGTDGIGLTGSYWQLYGLEVANAPHNGIKIQGSNSINPAGSHNTIERCVFRNCGNTGFQLGSSTLTTYIPSDNLVLNCDAYRNYDSAKHGEDADGFAAKWYIGTNNVFRGCRSWENSDDGWDLWMGINRVLIDNCWAFRNGSNCWNDTNFQGNGNGFKLGGGDPGGYVPAAHRVVRCVAFNNMGDGGHGFDQNYNTAGLTLDDNTAWANPSNNFALNSTTTTAGVHVVHNNLSIDGTIDIQSSAIQTSNSWQVITSPDASTNDVLSIDVAFAVAPRRDDGSLPESPFMRPVPGGRLVDKGADIGEPFSGSAPDLGAYETPVW